MCLFWLSFHSSLSDNWLDLCLRNHIYLKGKPGNINLSKFLTPMNFYIFQLCIMTYLCSSSIAEKGSANLNIIQFRRPYKIQTQQCNFLSRTFMNRINSFFYFLLSGPNKRTLTCHSSHFCWLNYLISLIVLRRQCVKSNPLLAGHTCIVT